VEAKTTEQQDLRQGLHAMWAAVATGWDEHADFVDKRGRALTGKLLDLAAVQAGDRVLELACGPGGLGLAAAERVDPGGAVVLSDVATEMTTIAGRRAAALGLDDVTTAVLDIERIDQPDASYDVVLCREGLMFALDPAQAAREIRRVLRPGGRLALAVWGPRERNPWLGAVLDSVSAQVGAPVPPPRIPGPFALEDAAKLGGLLENAGLRDVTVTEVPVPLEVDSFDEWWRRTTALAGPLAKMLELLPEDATRELEARAREAAKPYETPAGLKFPGVTLVAAATVG
jgi:ubiquinone/menaquinone biosynthesis C-methylase UbiE